MTYPWPPAPQLVRGAVDVLAEAHDLPPLPVPACRLRADLAGNTGARSLAFPIGNDL